MTGTELSSEASLDSFLLEFEKGTYPAKEWTHEAHVAMAAAYLAVYPLQEATERIRAGIPAYNIAQGGQNTDSSGYHETLTIFWIRILAAWLTEHAASTRLDAVRAATVRFGHEHKLHESYWSFDVVGSVEARGRWVEPDLRTL